MVIVYRTCGHYLARLSAYRPMGYIAHSLADSLYAELLIPHINYNYQTLSKVIGYSTMEAPSGFEPLYGVLQTPA